MKNQTTFYFSKQQILYFVIGSLFFIGWNILYSSFCFSQQVNVNRIDYETLLLKKGKKKIVLKKEDINKIYFTAIINTKNAPFYKIIIIDNNRNRYRFINIIQIKDISKAYQISEFMKNTENFWGIITNTNQIKYRNTLEKIEK